MEKQVTVKFIYDEEEVSVEIISDLSALETAGMISFLKQFLNKEY